MSKSKLSSKICWILVLTILLSSLICCFAACNSSDSGVVNVEGCQKQLVDSDFSGVSAIITDLQTVKQNQSVFESALNNSNVLIPERDSNSNVLAWQLIGFTQDGAVLYPIYLFNKVDKSQIDYAELVNDSSALLNNKEKEYIYSSCYADNQNAMSISVSYCVFVKNYLGKYKRIGMIKSKVAFYYFPIDNATYDHYIGRYETSVIPTSKYTFKSYDMTSMTVRESRMDENITYTNTWGEQLPSDGVAINTGILYRESYGEFIDKDVVASSGSNGFMKLTFDTPYYEKRGVANVVARDFIGHEREGYDDYWGFISTVSHHSVGDKITLAADRGKAYTGVRYTHYRAYKDVDDVGVNYLIDNLSLWGQVGEPSYNGGYDNYILISLASSHELTSKSITMKNSTNNKSGAIATSSCIIA